jgi:hypothetical protein
MFKASTFAIPVDFDGIATQSKLMGLAHRRPHKAAVGAGIEQEARSEGWLSLAPESVGRPKVADGGDDEGPEGHKKSGWFVTANADLSVIASRCRPPNHRADQPLKIAHMGFVRRRDASVR